MRRLRYNVAASLDGFLTDANGSFDWIPNDPTVDFAGIFARIDTVLMGRRSYDTVRAMEGPPAWPSGSRVYVASRELEQSDYPEVMIVRDPVAIASELRREDGSGEIWLFGGADLFATLLAAGQVDAVEVTIVPVLLGSGTPLVAAGIERTALTLTHSHVYPSGMIGLYYDVANTR